MKARLGDFQSGLIVNYGGYRGCSNRSVALLGRGVASAVVAIIGVGGFGGQRDRGSAVGLGAAVGDMSVTVPSSGPETVTWKP